VRTFAKAAGIDVQTSDISVAARILGQFPSAEPEQRVPDNLAELGKLTLRPEANIIKLPNISASVAQLKAAIKELQARATPCPTFPRARHRRGKGHRARYNKCIGSAVNPVLREGNSDRRAPRAVKEYARKHPHSMAEWSQASRTHVSHMHDGDFYHGEKSMTLDKARDVKMELITKSGKTIVLKPKVSLLDREVIDSMFMSKKALLDFYEKQIEDAQDRRDVLAARQGHHDEGLAPHRVRPLRAIFYKEAFAKHAKLFASWASTSTTAWSICTTRSPACPSQQDEIKPTCTPATSTAPSWPWSTRPRASPTSTRPTTSSSTPPCPP
jgi:isocitrate dehydrogenase